MSTYPGRYRPPHPYLTLDTAYPFRAARPWQRVAHNQLDPSVPVPVTEAAVIGTELRIPVATCELGPSCISRYTDPAADGFAGIRAGAIAAGWREDVFGRLTCPRCQQDSIFWARYSPQVWDVQIAMARMTGITGDPPDSAGEVTAAKTAVMPAVHDVIQIPAAAKAPAPRNGRGRHRRTP